MSHFLLEQLRQAHEDVETIEKAVAKLLAEKAKHPKHAVKYEHAIRNLLDSLRGKSQTALDIYADKDGLRRDEIQMLGGTRPATQDGIPDVFVNFDQQVQVIKDYHRKFAQQNVLPEIRDDAFFLNQAVAQAQDKLEAIFSGDEKTGKRVDLHPYYVMYVNLKKLKAHRVSEHRKEARVRLEKKKRAHAAEAGEGEQEAHVDDSELPEFQEIDYIQYLQTFDRFHEIPRHCKYRDAQYEQYLRELIGYLRTFFEKQNPIVDMQKIDRQFASDFDARWWSRLVPGWEQSTFDDPLYAIPSDYLFASEATKASHEKGKKYRKNAEVFARKTVDERRALEDASRDHDKTLAELEVTVQRFQELLGDTIQATIQYIQKKQSRTAEELDEEEEEEEEEVPEIEEEEEEGSDAEKPIYNPLNLPLGWDGKPIPYWLYKLHGLGIEYKCEICGNYSYWGRRAFERHFQEWRHAFGMRCLKIPNTSHFKEITRIEDALTLYEKLKKEAEVKAFRQDNEMEMEDDQGNVMSVKAYQDLSRQGLL
ncbi:unnamed protein product [Vitrella brassicaformis CCMP3155]|uniref:Matrin-type domain-containing protein n=2 Tax=Vitrella brassicaformis TaxID=1169539 RepID=A0A0G4F8N1_VITBC|nr:unnamed protein product [Vitrella brassicaformis CCMP3155]|eukprot:CEM09068.1 unnamed protein product [Vitrella brassicaformis CCMP3155]